MTSLEKVVNFIKNTLPGIKLVPVTGWKGRIMSTLGIAGFALPNVICWRGDLNDIEISEVILHEGAHQYQIKRDGWFKFYSRYFLKYPILSNMYRYNYEMAAYRVSYVFDVLWVKGYSVTGSNRGLLKYTSEMIDYLTSLSHRALYGWMRGNVTKLQLDKEHMLMLDKCIEQMQGKHNHYTDEYFCKVLTFLRSK